MRREEKRREEKRREEKRKEKDKKKRKKEREGLTGGVPLVPGGCTNRY
jgi:hypothetical protein